MQNIHIAPNALFTFCRPTFIVAFSLNDLTFALTVLAAEAIISTVVEMAFCDEF